MNRFILLFFLSLQAFGQKVPIANEKPVPVVEQENQVPSESSNMQAVQDSKVQADQIGFLFQIPLKTRVDRGIRSFEEIRCQREKSGSSSLECFRCQAENAFGRYSLTYGKENLLQDNCLLYQVVWLSPRKDNFLYQSFLPYVLTAKKDEKNSNQFVVPKEKEWKLESEKVIWKMSPNEYHIERLSIAFEKSLQATSRASLWFDNRVRELYKTYTNDFINYLKEIDPEAFKDFDLKKESYEKKDQEKYYVDLKKFFVELNTLRSNEVKGCQVYKNEELLSVNWISEDIALAKKYLDKDFPFDEQNKEKRLQAIYKFLKLNESICYHLRTFEKAGKAAFEKISCQADNVYSDIKTSLDSLNQNKLSKVEAELAAWFDFALLDAELRNRLLFKAIDEKTEKDVRKNLEEKLGKLVEQYPESKEWAEQKWIWLEAKEFPDNSFYSCNLAL